MDTMAKFIEIMKSGNDEAEKLAMAVEKHYKAMRDPQKDYTDTLRRCVRYEDFIRDVKAQTAILRVSLNSKNLLPAPEMDNYIISSYEIGNVTDMLSAIEDRAQEFVDEF